MRPKKSAKILLLVSAVLIAILLTFLFSRDGTDKEQRPTPVPSYTPVATPAPTVCPLPFDANAAPKTEDTTPGALAPNGEYAYSNPKPLSCQLYNGGTLTLGVSSELSDRLLLDPSFTEGESGMQYAIYISSTNVPVTFAAFQGDLKDAPLNANEESLLVLDRTYDTLVPSHSGAYWRYDIGMRSDERLGTTLMLRVVRLNDNLPMGSALCEVELDEGGTFRLKDLRSNDVSATKAISEDTRSQLISRAIAFIKTPEEGPRVSNLYEEYWGSSEEMSVVEKAPMLYFPQLMDRKQELLRAGPYRNKDIYAVSVPCPALGFVTVYFMPPEQMHGLLPMPGAERPESEDLEILGYDYLLPLSKDMLQTPFEDID